MFCQKISKPWMQGHVNIHHILDFYQINWFIKENSSANKNLVIYFILYLKSKVWPNSVILIKVVLNHTLQNSIQVSFALFVIPILAFILSVFFYTSNNILALFHIWFKIFNKAFVSFLSIVSNFLKPQAAQKK